MTIVCTYHCRSCDSCFTSLDAFDTHRAGGECWGADIDWTERDGVCKVSEFDPATAKPRIRGRTVSTLPMSDAQRSSLERLRAGSAA